MKAQFRKDNKLRYWVDLKNACLLYCDMMGYNSNEEIKNRYRVIKSFIEIRGSMTWIRRNLQDKK